MWNGSETFEVSIHQDSTGLNECSNLVCFSTEINHGRRASSFRKIQARGLPQCQAFCFCCLLLRRYRIGCLRNKPYPCSARFPLTATDPLSIHFWAQASNSFHLAFTSNLGCNPFFFQQNEGLNSTSGWWNLPTSHHQNRSRHIFHEFSRYLEVSSHRGHPNTWRKITSASSLALAATRCWASISGSTLGRQGGQVIVLGREGIPWFRYASLVKWSTNDGFSRSVATFKGW